jgi:hypothetical protein
LIDGPELVSLIDGMRSTSSAEESAATTRLRSETQALNGDAAHGDAETADTSASADVEATSPAADFDEEMLSAEHA